MDSTISQKEFYELKKSVDEIKSDITLALTRIGDKLATQSHNYLELNTKIERLNNIFAAQEQADVYGFAEVQNEPSNRDSTTNPAD
jgi:hypothetical protein